jgi:hypothetical protein
MVEASNRLGLYIAIPAYFAMLCLCAFWVYRRMEKQNSKGMTDHLMNHYLGGRNFGAILSAGTVLASLFSGYTVVGVVNGTVTDEDDLHNSTSTPLTVLFTSLCCRSFSRRLDLNSMDRDHGGDSRGLCWDWHPPAQGILDPQSLLAV